MQTMEQRVADSLAQPRLLRSEIPMTGPGSERCIDHPLEVRGHTFHVTAVSMGNPHAVAFVGDKTRELAETIGPFVERHAWFPNRTNAEFARVIMQTWEDTAATALMEGLDFEAMCARVSERTGRLAAALIDPA